MDAHSSQQKPDHVFHDPTLTSDKVIVTRKAPPQPQQPFEPLPQPTGKAPYHLSLADVLPAEQMQAITAAGHICFHIVGDTGGVQRPEAQQIVADHMIADIEAQDASLRPAFFYHLGDVVYFYGQASDYYPQFYEPYAHYPAPIFAIPGNHDGDIDPAHQDVPSLAAFVRNFCATRSVPTQEAEDAPRSAMTQPNVYWTLDAPFVTIVGMYTNVPEGGVVEEPQLSWLEQELRDAPQDKALIVAMHHPIYSADAYHSGSDHMKQVLEGAIAKTGRVPDMVFAGHVHNYQRFTLSQNGREIPYIVAGGGGYWHLHSMAKSLGATPETPVQMPEAGLTLESYAADRHGFLRLEVSQTAVTGSYFTVPLPQESWSSPAQRVDLFTLDLQQHRTLLPTP